MSELAQRTKQRGSTTFRGARAPSQQALTLFDVTLRNLLGQQATTPNIPITTPLQQSISGQQDIMQPLFNRAFGPQTQQGLAGRLAAGGQQAPAVDGGGIAAAPGVPEFGRTQTREDLQLPDRSEYFPFQMTPEELEAADLVPPVRQTGPTKKQGKRIRRTERRVGKLERRVERRQARGKGTAKAEKRLARARERLATRQGRASA